MKSFRITFFLLASWSVAWSQTNTFPTSGYAGIGTTSPSSPLHLSDNSNTKIRLTDTDGTVDWGISTSNSDLFYITDLTNSLVPLKISSSTPTNTLYLSSSGRVGIGTANPRNKQHIIAAADNDGLLIERDHSSNNTYSGILFKNVYNDQDLYKKGAIYFEKTGTGGIGRFHFALKNETDSTNVDINDARLTIHNSGKVGIGTRTPTTTLDVEGQIRLSYNSSTGLGGSINIDNPTGEIPSISLDQGGTRWWQYVDSDNTFRIGRGSNYNSNAASLALKGDNVGIGTSSPANGLLHIYKNATTGNFGFVNVANAGLRIQDSGVSLYIDGNALYTNGNMILGTLGNKYLSLGTNDEERLRIDQDGDVGIGTSTPNSNLHVNETATAGTDHVISRWETASGGGLSVRVSDLSLSNPGWQFNAYAGESLSFSQGGTDRMFIKTDGNVGIGTTDPLSKLSVDGHIRATEVKVLLDISVPDYVFEPDYELRTLKETKKYIAENKHLPEIPSAVEIEENGIDLGDMNMRLLKKIEELTLHQIELLEKLEEQSLQLLEQNQQLSQQQRRIEKLEMKK